MPFQGIRTKVVRVAAQGLAGHRVLSTAGGSAPLLTYSFIHWPLLRAVPFKAMARMEYTPRGKAPA